MAQLEYNSGRYFAPRREPSRQPTQATNGVIQQPEPHYSVEMHPAPIQYILHRRFPRFPRHPRLSSPVKRACASPPGRPRTFTQFLRVKRETRKYFIFI
jgi:hypothetical protein